MSRRIFKIVFSFGVSSSSSSPSTAVDHTFAFFNQSKIRFHCCCQLVGRVCVCVTDGVWVFDFARVIEVNASFTKLMRTTTNVNDECKLQRNENLDLKCDKRIHLRLQTVNVKCDWHKCVDCQTTELLLIDYLWHNNSAVNGDAAHLRHNYYYISGTPVERTAYTATVLHSNSINIKSNELCFFIFRFSHSPNRWPWLAAPRLPSQRCLFFSPLIFINCCFSTHSTICRGPMIRTPSLFSRRAVSHSHFCRELANDFNLSFRIVFINAYFRLCFVLD